MEAVLELLENIGFCVLYVCMYHTRQIHTHAHTSNTLTKTERRGNDKKGQNSSSIKRKRQKGKVK